MSVRAHRPFELPARRISRGEKIIFRSHKFFLHCGFHTDGTVREIFVSAKRETADLMEMLSDICILVSKQLQSGARLSDLAIHARDNALGVLIARAIKIEAEESAAVLALYAQRVAA